MQASNFRFLLTILLSSSLVCGVLLMPRAIEGEASSWKESERTLRVGPGKIRVLVAEGISGEILEVTGAHRVYDKQTGKKKSTSRIAKLFPLNPLNTGLMWGEEYPGVYQIQVVPGPLTEIVFQGKTYAGEFNIYQSNGQLTLVNEVSIEDYCQSLLTQNLSDTYPEEVMAALAISARTHAYFHAEGAYPREELWDVRLEEVDYVGVLPENPAVDAALHVTRHMVLKHGHGGETFPAIWTEDSAGKTASYQTIFRRSLGPNLSGLEVPLAERHRQASAWSTDVPKEWLATRIGLQTIFGVNLFTDVSSKKVYGIRFFDENTAKNFTYHELQNLLGSDTLLSTDFVVELEGEQVIFAGYGKGHGVGVCLYAAQEMAKRGKNAAEILHTFYPQAELALVAKDPNLPRLRELAHHLPN